MIAFFCEECGGRNTFDADILDGGKSHFECRFCHELAPLPQIRGRLQGKKIIDTKSFKILVVDDEPMHVDLIKAMLENEYSIITAGNGEEALGLAARALPDLILMDVMMPDMTGRQACKKLKADKQTRHIPVIFVTSLTDTNDEKKGLEVGAVDYITKPINSEIAKARIAIHLELKRQFDQRKKEARKFSQSIKWLEQQVMSHQSAEMEAQQARFELEQTLDVVDHIVTIQDTEKRVIRANKAACDAFAKPPDELVGRYCYELFQGTSKPCANCPDSSDTKHANTKPIQIQNQTLNKTFLVNQYPRFDDKGVAIGFMHVAKEISLPQMAASYLKNKSLEEPECTMVQRGDLNRAAIDNLLTVMDTLSIILLNNELIRASNENDDDMAVKTERISNAVSRASMLITETINATIHPKAVSE